MKLALAVIIGLAIAAGLTYYYQPQLFHLSLPTPDIVVTSPVSGESVNPKFTVSGLAKNSDPTVSVSVLNFNQDISVNKNSFSVDVDLTGQVRPGDKITLTVGPPSSPLLIPLTIKP